MHKLFYSNLLPGTILFRRFKLLKCLSSSDLAGVYLCSEQPDGENLVVLKIVNSPRKDGDQDRRSELRRELLISSAINHPNILGANHYYEDDDFVAFSMDYVPGGTLADKLDSGEHLSTTEILNWLTQIASGLNAIHSEGICHRDLKPENVLIDEEGTIRIADFGIATSGPSDSAISAERLTGTINFLSPEYIAYGLFDERSDIYAWGVIAYLLTTGRLPFFGDTLIDTLAKRVTHDPMAPCKINSGIDRRLSSLILDALKRKVDERVQTSAELLARLAALQTVEEEEIFTEAA